MNCKTMILKLGNTGTFCKPAIQSLFENVTQSGTTASHLLLFSWVWARFFVTSFRKAPEVPCLWLSHVGPQQPSTKCVIPRPPTPPSLLSPSCRWRNHQECPKTGTCGALLVSMAVTAGGLHIGGYDPPRQREDKLRHRQKHLNRAGTMT